MNSVYRSIWNERKQAYVAVAENTAARGKNTTSTVSLLAPVLCSVALLPGVAAAADLPTSGQIGGGGGTIATSGSQMTIHQTTNKLVIDWQSFSIGQGKTVEFVQPSSSAVALNRVLGTDVSVIQGALKANGQVFLVNPNGVLFTPTAQVNVGGIVASTLQLKTDDFLAGTYRFEGASSNAIVNQGHITAAAGGTVALIAARITHVGQIHAERGNVLMGAGSKVKLDLGGPVKIEVEAGAIDALIEQGGGVRADGGLVYLTAKAVGQLTTSVINHTGITEARTLATGEKGAIYLMGDMVTDRIVVGGRLDASAPHGGGGGFIETSAGKVSVADDVQITTAAAAGPTGQWLIDPVDFKIAATGGDITGASLGTLLNSNSVTIQTAAGTNSSTNLYATTTGNGDITVNDAITKTSGTATTLTLAADRDIVINNTGSISGSAGSPLHVVLAARAKGGDTGSVTVNGTIRTYGGNVTIGGGDMSASGYAVAPTYNNVGTYYPTGVDITAMVDATADGSGTANTTLPTAAAGGNIAIRGKGSTAATSSYNWGVHLDYWASRSHYGTVVTGGNGTIDIIGYGGNGGANSYALGSIGIAIEGTANVKANTGNITLKGYQGTGIDQYGIVTSTTLIGTKGWLLMEGDSLLLRGNTLTVSVGQDSDVKTPIVGCSSTAAYGICGSGAAAPKLEKLDTGVLNLWGNAAAWDASRPANTTASYTNKAIFTDASNKVNVVGITSAQAFYAFVAPTATVTAVTESSSSASTVTLRYTLSALGGGGEYVYSGSAYTPASYWSASSIFGNSYSGWQLGTDYKLHYGGAELGNFTNAGTYSNISATILRAGYALAATGNTVGSFTITPKTLAVTGLSALNKTYDGTTAASLNGVASVSAIGSDVVSVTGTATAVFANKNVGTGKAVTVSGLSLSGAAAGNYRIAQPAGLTASIGRADLAVTGLAANNKTYDGTTAASLSGTASVSAIGSDVVSVSGAATGSFASKDAGTGKAVSVAGLSLSGSDAGNYSLVQPTGLAASINTASLIVTGLTANHKTYDGTTAASLSGTASVAAIGSDVVSVSGAPTGAFASKNAGTGKVVSVSGLSLTGADAGNYSVVQPAGLTANISTAPLVVSAANQTRTYGDANPALTASLTGFVSGETLASSGVTGAARLTTAATASTGVGTADIVAALGTLAASNYEFRFANGTLRIDPRPITVTADAVTRPLLGVDPALTFRITAGDLVSGDTLAGALARNPGKAPGRYAINRGTLGNGNYDVQFVGDFLTISEAPPAQTSAIAAAQALPIASPMQAVRPAQASGLPQPRLELSSGAAKATDSSTSTSNTAPSQSDTGRDASGFMRIVVVRGGVNTDFGQREVTP